MPTKTGWKKASVQKCKAVYDTCAQVYKAIGKLPEGKKPDDLISTTAGEILDFGQKLADDDVIWKELPNCLHSGESKREVREYLRQVLEESR